MTDHTIDTASDHRLIASDRVEGTAVYNRSGERLGTIHNFMVNKRSGKAEYAVMNFGGLFGLGGDRYPLPWDVLTYDTTQGGYVVDIDKSQLENAPKYNDSNEPLFDDGYGREVHRYYGIAFPF
jgi:sporulation protein YlmC with PRC-barrel domain